MATPASVPAAISSSQDPQLLQASLEGHDGDLPTDAPGRPPTNSTLAASKLSTDIEKGAEPESVASLKNEEHEEGDPNVVDWDGPSDPANPQNWSSRKKWGNIAVLAVCTLITPLASSMFAPGVPQVMREFESNDQQLATFVVSIYILGFAFGPLIIAPISEMWGRLVCYNGANLLFTIFSIACAVSSDMGQLVGFRFLMGCAGSAPLTIGAGTIADMMPPETRGSAMAIWAMGPLLGPVIGPVAGGYLVEAAGWRWVYWLLTIVAGLFTILSFFTLSETYHPTLLHRKTQKLIKETGNTALRSKLDNGLAFSELLRRAIVRPTKMLIFSPVVLLLSLYVAVAYGILYLLFTTFTFVFEEQYAFSPGSIGLTYIPTGIGMFTGLIVVGASSDRIIKRHIAAGDTLNPEMRFPDGITIPCGLCIPIGLFIYGWTVQYHVHWIVPLLGTLIVGVGLISCMMCINTYLVDAFTLYSASAMAANTLLRSTAGALLPLGGLQMYDRLGLGWGNSLLAFIALALVPAPALIKRFGSRLRERFAVNF